MEFCPVGPEDLETIAVLSEQYLTHGKKIKDDIQFRKFSMKCALGKEFKNEKNNKDWLNLFPETYSYI